MNGIQDLLPGLIHPDNNVRKQATDRWEADLKSNPPGVLMQLVGVLSSHAQADIRNLALVLLRNSLLKKQNENLRLADKNCTVLWHTLSEEQRDCLKTALVSRLCLEECRNNRRSISDCIAVVISILSMYTEDPVGSWSHLFISLSQYCRDENEGVRESGVSCVGKVAGALPLPYLRRILGDIVEIVHNGLTDRGLSVRVISVQAIGRISFNLENADLPALSGLVPGMFSTLETCLGLQKFNLAKKVLQGLISITSMKPNLLKGEMGAVTDAYYQVALMEDLPDVIRINALECLLSLCEEKPSLFRKKTDLVSKLLELAMQFMLRVEMQPEWGNQTDEDDDIFSLKMHGEDALDRLALCLGGPTVIGVIGDQIPHMVRHENWKNRYVVMMTMALICEGCAKTIKPHLGEWVDLILTCIHDQHPLVRYASIMAITHACVEYPGILASGYHDKVMPNLLQSISSGVNEEFPRIRASACLCIVTYCENSSSDFVIPYHKNILTVLQPILQNPTNAHLMESTFPAISAVAKAVKTLFAPFYDEFVPFLKSVLMRCKTDDMRGIRGRVIEAICHIGMGVNSEKFYTDGAELMNYILGIFPLSDDDPALFQILKAPGYICRVLKGEFIPFLDRLVPILLEYASKAPDLVISDVFAEEEYAEDRATEFDYFQLDNQIYGVSTLSMQEKGQAIQQLIALAETLKGKFLPYLQVTMEAVVPFCRFLFNDDVRLSALEICPALVGCMVDGKTAFAGQEGLLVKGIWGIIQILIDAMASERNPTFIDIDATTIGDCLGALDAPILEQEHIRVILQAIHNGLMVCIERFSQEEENVAGLDEEELAELHKKKESQEAALQAFGDLWAQLVRSHNDHVVEGYLQILHPLVQQLLHEEAGEVHNQIGCFIIAEWVEYTTRFTNEMLQTNWDILALYARSPSAVVRRVSHYGLGVMAITHTAFTERVAEAVFPTLKRFVLDPGEKDEDQLLAFENTVSAVGKIIRHCGQSINAPAWVELFVQGMPITHDLSEASQSGQMLIQCYHENPTLCMGQGLERIANVVFSLCFVITANSVLNGELFEADVMAQAQSTLTTIQSQVDADTFTMVLQSCPDHLKNYILPLTRSQ